MRVFHLHLLQLRDQKVSVIGDDLFVPHNCHVKTGQQRTFIQSFRNLLGELVLSDWFALDRSQKQWNTGRWDFCFVFHSTQGRES